MSDCQTKRWSRDTTHRDGERPLPGGGLDVDRDPPVCAEHELSHRQQAGVGHVPQSDPGHLRRVRRIKASKVSRKRRDNLCCSNKAVTHRLPLGIVNGAVEDCPAARGHGHVPGGPCQVYYRWRSIQDLIQNVIIRIWWRTSDSRVWSFWKFLIQANLKRNASKTNLQL